MRPAALLLGLASLAAPLTAQAILDGFNYPNGPAVPGWTPQRGTWQVQNGRLTMTSGSTWAYITRDGTNALDSVLDGTFYFNASSGVQFGGLTARHPGGSADSNLLMTKIQNNGGTPDFDRVFLYERGVSGNTYVDIPGGTLAAECRMVTLDNEFWFEVDADMDGRFELVTPRRAITLVTAPGLVGMNAFQTTELDDFEYFDAVLVPATGAVARVGANYDLALSTTMPNAPFIGMLAAGNAGLPLGDGRAVPLTPDGILIASIGQPGLGLQGVTDGNGDATPAIPIPAIPSLVGARLYASFFTLDGQRPLGIGDISNEQYFEIQP